MVAYIYTQNYLKKPFCLSEGAIVNDNSVQGEKAEKQNQNGIRSSFALSQPKKAFDAIMNTHPSYLNIIEGCFDHSRGALKISKIKCTPVACGKDEGNSKGSIPKREQWSKNWNKDLEKLTFTTTTQLFSSVFKTCGKYCTVRPQSR